MNVILIFLTGTLMGAFNFAFYLLGYHLGGKKEESVEINKDNAEYLANLMKWRDY